jgi:hypothetical protein
MYAQKQKKRSNPSSAPSVHEDNLVIAIVIMITITALCSVVTAFILQETLDTFQDSNAMVMLITDSGIKSDDKDTERRLSSATMAMIHTRDVSIAMFVGILMAAAGMTYRFFKGKR